VTDDVGPVQGAIASGAVTDDNTPTLRIGVGADVQAGDTLQVLLLGSTWQSPYTLTAADVANGYADVPMAHALMNGPRQALSVTLTHDGATSAASASFGLDVEAFVAPPTDALHTSLSDGGYVLSFNGANLYGETVTYLQRYDAGGAAVGGELHFNRDDLAPFAGGAASGYSGTYGVTALAGGEYLVQMQADQRYPFDGYQLVDASGAVIRTFATSGMDTVIAGAQGGFLLREGISGPVAPDDHLQLFDQSGAAMTASFRLAGPITSITAAANGNMDISWTDHGAARTLVLDPREYSGLADPAAPALSVMDDVGPQTGAVANGAATDDADPTFRVAVSQEGEVEFRFGTFGDTTAVQVTASDVARGYVDVHAGHPLADGNYTFEARVDDADGLASNWTLTGFSVDAPAASAAPGQVMTGGDGGATLQGGAGDDTVSAGSGPNYLRGADGDDSLAGGSGFNDINGNKGDDVITGHSSIGDWLVGGQGNDLISTTTSGNILYGNLGNDTLQGGTGHDLIRGGQGDDSIVAGSGPEWISGDRGADTIEGGSGADTFHSFSGAGTDIVIGFDAGKGDHVQLDLGTHYTLSQSGADTVVDMGGGDQLVLRDVTLSTLPTGWLFAA
jgi:Ca2+-binding RTX toxin-like protein